MLKMAKLEFENHKNQYSLGCLDPNKLRPIFLEIAWQNWPFKIGLSLLDFKQLLVNNGIIVQCTAQNVLSMERSGFKSNQRHNINSSQQNPFLPELLSAWIECYSMNIWTAITKNIAAYVVEWMSANQTHRYLVVPATAHNRFLLSSVVIVLWC